jgi:proteic killer suppression protein
MPTLGTFSKLARTSVGQESRLWRFGRLDQIENASNLNDLRAPPGNRLEALKGDRVGQHSIRINDQYRVCFLWKADGAHEVEISDYH